MTGDFNSIEKEVPAEGLVYIETTTEEKIEPQNANRTFEFFTDNSPEQTREVLRSQAYVYKRNEKDLEKKYRIWTCVQELIEQYPVIIPFAEQLAEDFPIDKVRARRDFPRLLGLTEASALLHQKNREIKEHNGEKKIIATEQDLEIALEIVNPILTQTYKDLSPKEEALANIIKSEYGFGYIANLDEKYDIDENTFSPKDLHSKILELIKSKNKEARDFKAYSTLRDYIYKIVGKGLLEWNNKKGNQSKYALINDIPNISFHISLSQSAKPPSEEKNSNDINKLGQNSLAKTDFSQTLAKPTNSEGLAKNEGFSQGLAKTESSQTYEPNSPKSLDNPEFSSLANKNIEENKLKKEDVDIPGFLK